MSYVPGYQHDVFLSYERGDTPWVEAFRKALAQAVRDRLGQDPRLWQDVQSIRFGQDWTDEIARGISETAAFLAVCSPSYFRSLWCTQEYNTFAPEGRLDPLAVGTFYRFLKVVRTPDMEGLHREFFSTLQPVEFFDGKSNEEYLPGTKEFDSCIRKAAGDLARLLVTMRNTKLKLYVATTADDLQDEWKQLRTDLFDHAFDVQPQEILTSAFSDAAVRNRMKDAKLAVFLLGGRSDKFVRRQIDQARDLGVPMVFWIHPRKSKDAGAEHQQLLDEIRTASDLPQGSQVLGAKTTQDLIHDIVELLEPQPPKAVADDVRSVYLLHDPNQQHESERARGLRAVLAEHKLAVVPDETAGLSIDRHEQFMRDCDGLLLYRGSVPGPDRWLREYLGDVLLADANYGPKAAKTLLLENPAQVVGVSGVDVLPYAEPLNPQLLQPFIARIQQSRQIHAGD